MAIVNGSLELGYKNTAWFAANPTLVLKEGQIVYLEQTGTYKIGNGVSTLSALSFLGVSSETQTLQNVTDLGSTTTNSITANSFVKSGGLNTEFLKADGSVDSTTYISGITSGMVTTALGFTPYNSTNPSGYITGITSGMVTTALGFTPYDASNPSGYITSSALSSYVPYTGATGNVNLGTHSLTASDLIINHASGSGVAASITKGGSDEALTVVKSSGSGNVASFTGGNTFISTLTTPTINGVSGLLSFGSTDRVSVGNYATPSAQRMFTVGQDTAFTSIGSMIGATGSSAIYMNVATPSAVNYVLRSSGSNLFLNTPSASDSLILSTGGVANRFVITGTFGGASFNAFALLGASNTNQTASTAVAGWNYQSFSRQWAAGNITAQSENIWNPITYSFATTTSTITNAYGNVFNAPIAGTNCTITNNFAARFNGQLYLTQTVTTETVVQTKTVTIVINGVTYKLLAA